MLGMKRLTLCTKDLATVQHLQGMQTQLFSLWVKVVTPQMRLLSTKASKPVHMMSA